MLRWREEHARPKVSIWVGRERQTESDTPIAVVRLIFANRGHDRELTLLQFEVPKPANVMLDYTVWKSPDLVKAGSMRMVRIPLEVVCNQIGLYMPNATNEQLAKTMGNLKVVFSTGDGDRHAIAVTGENRRRLVDWVRERASARRAAVR